MVNPWVLVNGKRNWRTAADIADEALRSYGDPKRMTDAEKARAIWDFQRHHRFHATTGDLEVRDPVKLYNVYGYALCGDNAPVLADLWRIGRLPHTARLSDRPLRQRGLVRRRLAHARCR